MTPNMVCVLENIPNVKCFGVDVARGEAEGNIHPEAFYIWYVLEAAVNIFYIISLAVTANLTACIQKLYREGVQNFTTKQQQKNQRKQYRCDSYNDLASTYCNCLDSLF